MSRAYFIVGIFCIILLALPSKSMASDFEVINRTEFAIASARMAGEPLEKRWGALELQVFYLFEGGSRLGEYKIISLDCSIGGIGVVRKFFNIETDNSKKPKWASGSVNSIYENGFKPSEIKHTPLPEHLERERRDLLEGANEETRKIIVGSKPISPEVEEALVAFGCSIIRDGLSAKDAGNFASNTAGLSNVTALICTFQEREGARVEPLIMSVRFHESRSIVQAQGIWRKNGAVFQNSISFQFRGNEISINRLTGRGSIVVGGQRLTGNCEIDEGKKKF